MFLCDEHIGRKFGGVLDAYGHGCIWVVDNPLWVGKADASHLVHLRQAGADFYLTLDHNREPDVWAAVYGKLIEGVGRMLRIKPRRRDPLGIPTITKYWALAYERIEPWLEDPNKKLIQVGMEINRNRREPGWARAYAVSELSQAVQQRMRIVEDRLVQGGTPRLNVPRGRGRPRKE